MLNDNKTNLSCSLIFNHQSVWRRVPPGPNQSPTSQLKAQDSIKHFILRSKIVSQLTWRSSWQWTRRWCLRWRVQQEDEMVPVAHHLPCFGHTPTSLRTYGPCSVPTECSTLDPRAMSLRLENIGNCRRTYRWWSQCTPLSLWLVRARSCWTFCILVLASSRCDRSVLAQRPLDLWIDWRHHPSRLTKPRQWARPWNGPSETHRCSPSSHFCKISSGNHPRSSCHCHCWSLVHWSAKISWADVIRNNIPKHGIGIVEGIAPIIHVLVFTTQVKVRVHVDQIGELIVQTSEMIPNSSNTLNGCQLITALNNSWTEIYRYWVFFPILVLRCFTALITCSSRNKLCDFVWFIQEPTGFTFGGNNPTKSLLTLRGDCGSAMEQG